MIGTLEDAGDEDHYIVTSVAFAEQFWVEEGCVEIVIERTLGASSFQLCEGEELRSLLALPNTGARVSFTGDGPAVYGFGI